MKWKIKILFRKQRYYKRIFIKHKKIYFLIPGCKVFQLFLPLKAVWAFSRISPLTIRISVIQGVCEDDIRKMWAKYNMQTKIKPCYYWITSFVMLSFWKHWQGKLVVVFTDPHHPLPDESFGLGYLYKSSVLKPPAPCAEGDFRVVISRVPHSFKKAVFLICEQGAFAYPIRLNHRSFLSALCWEETCKWNIDFTCEQHGKSTETSAFLQVTLIVAPSVSLTTDHTSIWKVIMHPSIKNLSQKMKCYHLHQRVCILMPSEMSQRGTDTNCLISSVCGL